MEGDPFYGRKIVCDVTKYALEELMTEQTIVLGELREQLQALQVRPLGMMTLNLAKDIADTE